MRTTRLGPWRCPTRHRMHRVAFRLAQSPLQERIRVSELKRERLLLPVASLSEAITIQIMVGRRLRRAVHSRSVRRLHRLLVQTTITRRSRILDLGLGVERAQREQRTLVLDLEAIRVEPVLAFPSEATTTTPQSQTRDLDSGVERARREQSGRKWVRLRRQFTEWRQQPAAEPSAEHKRQQATAGRNAEEGRDARPCDPKRNRRDHVVKEWRSDV